MALNFLQPNLDFVQRTAESRRITRTLVGDFTFDLFNDQHRNKIFLSRNMTKVLAFHERNRTRGLETGTFRSSSSRHRGPILGNGAVSSKGQAVANSVNGTARRSGSVTNDNERDSAQDSSNAKPDTESMSQDCLKVRAQNGVAGEQARENRRSIRHQLVRQHEDKNAQLYFDLVNIRKKLNFKDSAPDHDQRPRKRAKRESITCHCHVTIWDNRKELDQKESIVRKSELCEVSTSDLGSVGFLAEIKLQKPFVFRSSELQVPLNTSQGTILGIGDKYFLEIKIIPVRNDVAWPPVPVLGRSEGDQSTGLGRMAAEKLQGSLVARYMHLPQAPASDVPLSVFFLHDGTTYRSKYGLEISSAWTRGETSGELTRPDENTRLDLWTLDEEGRSFGRRDSSPTQTAQKETSSRSRTRQARVSPSPIKIIYNIDAASAKSAKDFRKCTVTGLRCPACSSQTFHTLEDLQFHFLTIHSKYKFTVEKRETHPTTEELISITFKISASGTAKPRNSDREPRRNEKDLNWQAPVEPLDLPAYVNGDQNWVEQNWIEGPPKKSDPATAIAVVPDPVAGVRRRQHAGFAPAQKGGFLPAEHVSLFREPARPKHPNIKLRTMTSDKEVMYSSVSHRQISVDEDARSESDDEIDDGWYVNKSLEALDIAAEKQNWTDEQRILRRKWNQARLREKLSHPRYLSDCLIRFVRAEKVWLGGGGADRKSAFVEFIDELQQRRVVNQEVIRDLWTILHVDKSSTVDGPAEGSTKPTTAKEGPPSPRKPWNLRQPHIITPRQEWAEYMLQLPQFTCAVCIKPVADVRQHGVHCSEHECEAPGVWYHNYCVKCKKKDKLGWKCKLCIERLEEATQRKGKEVAMDRH